MVVSGSPTNTTVWVYIVTKKFKRDDQGIKFNRIQECRTNKPSGTFTKSNPLDQ